MVSITAVIRCRARDARDPCVFTTYERFTDTAAMDTHNSSAAVARFFATAKPILDGEVMLHVGEEMWATDHRTPASA